METLTFLLNIFIPVVVAVQQLCYPAWQYWGPTGQDQWCCMGMNSCCGAQQSPININPQTAILDNLPCLNLHNYHCITKSMSIHNNGQTIELLFNSYGQNSKPFISGGPLKGHYDLDRLLFHWGRNSSVGSEHTLAYSQLPMEIQFVHRNQKYQTIAEARSNADGLVFLSVFYVLSEHDNQGLREVVYNLESIRWLGHTKCIKPLSFMSFMPWTYYVYYHYKGSLPYPPCFEDVQWIVFHHPLPISNQQLDQFRMVQDLDEGSCRGFSCPMADNFRKINCKYNRPVFFKTQCGKFINQCGWRK